MKVGVGLPAAIPHIPTGTFLFEWAKKAEELGFSSLGLIDRLVYPNYEPLVTFAAAAAVTKRIRLMTTILLAPTRETALLAKQAATLDRISNGRLTLGLGIGSRKDDFDATDQEFGNRGKRFEKQLALMKKIWNGERISTEVGSVGPPPIRKGGPELLIGGYDPRAIERIGRWADGYISGSGGDPKVLTSIYKLVEESWKKNRRAGKPRLVCSLYFALGNNATERGGPYLRSYYGGFAERLLKGLQISSDQLKETLSAYNEIGADEVMLWPTIPEMEQLELLSKALPVGVLR
jgi:alkanesulfonate monooxygenase SsuD/methylene tetrahydromethanopterin reductase-like flavin-dependent oxidoreductase (luciferase family)